MADPTEAIIHAAWHEYRYPRPATDEPTDAFRRAIRVALTEGGAVPATPAATGRIVAAVDLAGILTLAADLGTESWQEMAEHLLRRYEIHERPEAERVLSGARAALSPAPGNEPQANDAAQGERVRDDDGTVWHVNADSVRPVPQGTVEASDRLAAVRRLYVEWSGSVNPVLQSAAGLLRQAGGFSLTDEEREHARRRHGH